MVVRVVIDDKLVEEARIVGKHATKKAVVNEALVEYIQRRKQAEIIELFHTVEYAPTFSGKSSEGSWPLSFPAAPAGHAPHPPHLTSNPPPAVTSSPSTAAWSVLPILPY